MIPQNVRHSFVCTHRRLDGMKSATVLGLVLVGALLASCGTTTRCSSATCSGCCDSAGSCVTQVTVGQCGSFGVACQACRLGEACVVGSCTATSVSGGGGGGATGGGAGGGTGGGSSAPSVLEATPTALQLSGCPGTVSTGGFLLTNRASSPLSVDVSISDGGLYSLGTLPTAPMAPDASVVIPVLFQPLSPGDSRATVTATGRSMTAAPISVELLGTALNLAPVPTLETGPQKTDRSGYSTCTADSTLMDCSLDFPDTLVGSVATREVRVFNRGCAPLDVTSITTEVVAPATATFSVSPSTLRLNGGAMGTIVVSVTPSSGGIQYGWLVLRSNDPVVGDGLSNPSRLSLSVNGR